MFVTQSVIDGITKYRNETGGWTDNPSFALVFPTDTDAEEALDRLERYDKDVRAFIVRAPKGS